MWQTRAAFHQNPIVSVWAPPFSRFAARLLTFMSLSSKPLSIEAQLTQDICITAAQVSAAVALLDSGATVPFIARYRKEATNGLDDIQLRALEARLACLREMAERCTAIVKIISEMGKLSPALHAALLQAASKQELEDIYLPFKQKRRAKGQLAREAGLEPLADALLANLLLSPETAALAYVIPQVAVAEGADKPADFSTIALVLDGVRDLLSERWAQDPAIVAPLREWLWGEASLQTRLRPGKSEADPEVAKFRDYFEYDEPLARLPSHRALAVMRGKFLEYLDSNIIVHGSSNIPSITRYSNATDKDTIISISSSDFTKIAEYHVAKLIKWQFQNRPADALIRKTLAWTWRVKLSLSLERDLMARLREGAEKVAIKVFADNLRDLLLAAPAGPRVVMGLDPGIRTGVKVAVVDATGKLVDTATVFPHEPRRDWDGALHQLALLCHKHQVTLIAIGNGTASRETDKLAAELIRKLGLQAVAGQMVPKIDKVVVSEAGASVYSASAYASQEMPDVDVSLRGAASIARRLQDPLAELVKIEPKAIGVGQYQHDLNQNELQKSLDATVEDCVNQVGVDLNTASEPLLTRVSGLSPSLAKQVVCWREKHGAFKNRQQLRDVTGLGDKTFEQAAGFLRIRGGDNPLDMTGVHPEAYPLVQKIITRCAKPIEEVMGRAELLKPLRPEQFADAQFGAVTVRDLLLELEKPGRDPRGHFKVAQLNDQVLDLKDLQVGMVLEGTVSNVAVFGAFIDLGVHQDGLVHVSQLSHKFVTDAREVVKTGDIVRVQVQEVDLERKRISLTMKLGQAPAQGSGGAGQGKGGARPNGSGGGNGGGPNSFQPASRGQRPQQGAASASGQGSAMAAAFAKLQR